MSLELSKNFTPREVGLTTLALAKGQDTRDILPKGHSHQELTRISISFRESHTPMKGKAESVLRLKASVNPRRQGPDQEEDLPLCRDTSQMRDSQITFRSQMLSTTTKR